MPEVELGTPTSSTPFPLPVHRAGGTGTPELPPRAGRVLEGKGMGKGRGAERDLKAQLEKRGTWDFEKVQGRPNIEPGSPVGGRGGEGRWGGLLQDPTFPHAFTGQSGASRARRVPCAQPCSRLCLLQGHPALPYR